MVIQLQIKVYEEYMENGDTVVYVLALHGF